jgi:protein dithiol oxidoreductase (disulfide-forming)
MQMKTSRRVFTLSTLAASLAIALPAVAQNQLRDGTEFRSIKPARPTDDAKRIEVVEFFWYACPHCNVLEPTLQEWVKKQGPDVHFRKVHVNFNPKHQQLYYTLEALGREKELSSKVFYRIHGEKDMLDVPGNMADFLSQFGVNKKQFTDTFASFGVKNAMSRATASQEGYKVDGVPAFTVNGKFMTAPSMAGSNAAALAVLDHLIAQERKLRK